MSARVLVVDDEPAVVKVVGGILTNHGFEVVSSVSPFRALEIVRNGDLLHVVICDAMMPEMAGLEFIREIARISPTTASILMSGSNINPADLPAGVPLLPKPVSSQDLIATVQVLLERSVHTSRGGG